MLGILIVVGLVEVLPRKVYQRRQYYSSEIVHKENDKVTQRSAVLDFEPYPDFWMSWYRKYGDYISRRAICSSHQSSLSCIKDVCNDLSLKRIRHDSGFWTPNNALIKSDVNTMTEAYLKSLAPIQRILKFEFMR